MSNKQTAVQQLILEMEELKKTKLYQTSFKAIDDCIALAYNKLAIEQEQIQEAFKQGYECDEVDEVFEIKETMFTAEGYYNKEYGGDTIQNTKDKMYSEEEVIKIVEISRATGLTAEYLIEQFKYKTI